MKWLAWLGAWVAGSYVVDVLVRPQLAAEDAIRYARSVGKPVLNVGAGTSGSSVRTWLLGPTLWGDVNIDIAAPRDVPPGPGRVSWGDAQRLPYLDKTFGSAIASHVLEHVRDPERMLDELHRVADRVYIIVPRWWAAHTWLHPGHRWYITEAGGGWSFTELWNGEGEAWSQRSSPPVPRTRSSCSRA